MLAKNEDPWAKFRLPKKNDTSPQSAPQSATDGPLIPSAADRFHTPLAKPFVGDIEIEPTAATEQPAQSGLLAKIRNGISKLGAKVWPKRVVLLERGFDEALPEMRDNVETSLGSSGRTWRLLTTRLISADRAIHSQIAKRFPRALAFTDWFLEWVFETVTSGAFQIISGLVAGVILLAKPNLITAIVALAWFITALWVARSGLVKRLTIGSRLFVITFFSLSFGFVFYAFGSWASNEYQNQQVKAQTERALPVTVPTPSAPPTPSASPTEQSVSVAIPAAKPTATPTRQRSPKRHAKGLTEEEKWILRQLNSNKNAHAQPSKKITKDELKRILARKLTQRGLDFLVKQLQERGIAFPFTPEIEKELRDHAASAGNKSIDPVIQVIEELALLARAEAVLSQPLPSPVRSPTSLATPVPTPSPTPSWKESEEAKQIANQLIKEVEGLIDEGRLIDARNIDQAIKAHNDWIEKCSVTLGKIDNALRRFGQNTSYKFEWEKRDRSIRRSKFTEEADEKRMFKLLLTDSILGLEIIKSDLGIATLPDLRALPSIPLAVAFLYQDKKIQIHNLTGTEFYLWGSKLGTGPVKMEEEPRVVSPEPFFYYIYGFEELALSQLAEGAETRTVYYLLVEDRRRQKFTLRCLLWARVKDRQLIVETQNLGTAEGWVQ